MWPLISTPESFILIGKKTLSALNNKTSVTIGQGSHNTIHGSSPKLIAQLASSLIHCESCKAGFHRQVGSIFRHMTGEKVKLVSFCWLLQQGGVHFQCGCHSGLKSKASSKIFKDMFLKIIVYFIIAKQQTICDRMQGC